MKKSLLLIITLAMSAFVCLSSCKTDAKKPEKTSPTIKPGLSMIGLSDFGIYCYQSYGTTYELYASSGYTDYKWYIDGEKIDGTGSKVSYTFEKAGIYEVLGTATKNSILYSSCEYIEVLK